MIAIKLLTGEWHYPSPVWLAFIAFIAMCPTPQKPGQPAPTPGPTPPARKPTAPPRDYYVGVPPWVAELQDQVETDWHNHHNTTPGK